MTTLATIEDVLAIVSLDAGELQRAESLINVVSARLRIEAKKVGKNLDDMIKEDSDLGIVVKSVVAGIVERTLKLQSTDSPIVSQFSESAMGYSFSGTVPNPGESLYIKKSELKALGLRIQRIGAMEVFDV